jgi:hypothetical protein
MSKLANSAEIGLQKLRHIFKAVSLHHVLEKNSKHGFWVLCKMAQSGSYIHIFLKIFINVGFPTSICFNIFSIVIRILSLLSLLTSTRTLEINSESIKSSKVTLNMVPL